MARFGSPDDDPTNGASLTIDPRTPVIIGAAQVSQWPEQHENPTDAADAIDLMTMAVGSAATDSGVRGVTSALRLVAVSAGIWRHRDPGRMIADQLGASEVHTLLTNFGGQMPISLAAHIASEIASGRLDMAVLVGGESTVTRHRLRRIGLKPTLRPEPPELEDHRWGHPLDMGDEVTVARGANLPINSYAILDSAIRAHRGESTDQGRRRAAEMWQRYAQVAATNPHASDRSAPDATTIMEVTPTNRMVSWPYTKAMCANNIVDRAGAVILCSTAAADRLGVPSERRVYPHMSVTATDPPHLLSRDRLDSVPGLNSVADVLSRRLGHTDRIAHFDIYACFPSIVDLVFETLGLPTDAVPTVTGGLAFAGAPINFAAGQSLAAMVQTVRDDPGTLGLVHGNGGHAAEHAVVVLSTEPSAERYETIECESIPGARALAPPDAKGDVVIDGFTVEHTSDGPVRAIAACRLDDGTRAWAQSPDPDLMSDFMNGEPVGWHGHIDDGRLSM